jgi:hypothetical protein
LCNNSGYEEEEYQDYPDSWMVPDSVNKEVPENRIINTKTGVPSSPGKPRFPGA